jgi:hypothetical protein
MHTEHPPFGSVFISQKKKKKSNEQMQHRCASNQASIPAILGIESSKCKK